MYVKVSRNTTYDVIFEGHYMPYFQHPSWTAEEKKLKRDYPPRSQTATVAFALVGVK